MSVISSNIPYSDTGSECYNFYVLRKDPIVTNHTYHIFNRGVNKSEIFFAEEDYRRFITAAIHYKRSTRQFSHFRSHFRSGIGNLGNLDKSKVKILSYCLMPNHFHFLIRQLEDGGITWFMQHLANSYAHYINVKYKRTGSLFGGRFENRLIETDEQLMHVSRYIHLNPFVADLVSRLSDYQWSSYTSFIKGLKDDIVDPKEILGFFKSEEDYNKFVLDQVNYAKELNRVKHLMVDIE